MTATGKGGKQAQQREPSSSLSEQAHKQIMDYLRIAEQSSHRDIRQTAIEIAKQTSTHERRQRARVPPTLILGIIVILGMLAVSASWYALLHYPPALARELNPIIILVFIVIAGIALFLSGRLSEANLMKMFGWLVSHVKEAWNAIKTHLV